MDYRGAVIPTIAFAVRVAAVWGLWTFICPPMGSPAKEGGLFAVMLVFVEFVWTLGMTWVLDWKHRER